MIQRLYRYAAEYRFYAFGTGEKCEVVEYEYAVTKETPCGYWIADPRDFRGKRWVSKTATKRFAYPTKQQALESLLARKKRHVQILESKLVDARMALDAALEFAKENPCPQN